MKTTLMKSIYRILTVVSICLPMIAQAASGTKKPAQVAKQDYTATYTKQMQKAKDVQTLDSIRDHAFDDLQTKYPDAPANVKQEIVKETKSKLDAQDKPLSPQQKQDIATAQQAYDKAVANEQSEANKTLEAAAIAAMGLGGMQLAQGISEKLADDAANRDMDAYVDTMRCTYGGGPGVRWGQQEISLPDTPEIAQYKADYLKIAEDLKKRKALLGMKPGIESEEVLDRTGLHEHEVSILGEGQFASRYRAKTGNEKDSERLAEEKKEAKDRMIAGGTVAGVGMVGSALVNSKMNSKDVSHSSSWNMDWSQYTTPNVSASDAMGMYQNFGN